MQSARNIEGCGPFPNFLIQKTFEKALVEQCVGHFADEFGEEGFHAGVGLAPGHGVSHRIGDMGSGICELFQYGMAAERNIGF